jgi:hypothetical protein
LRSKSTFSIDQHRHYGRSIGGRRNGRACRRSAILRYTGDMLAAMQILESSDTHVKIGLKGTKSYRKGLFNQNIDPWFGVSTTDDTKILTGIVEPIFHKNISDIG